MLGAALNSAPGAVEKAGHLNSALSSAGLPPYTLPRAGATTTHDLAGSMMRLFVTGPTGSGKSTLASRFAQKASLPLFALDDLHWIRHRAGDVRRDPAERLTLLETVVRRDAWIIEGVQFKWADPAMERADRIVVLDLPRWQNTMRILRRFAGRRRSTEGGSRGTLRALMEEMRWSADYYGHERTMLFEKVRRWPGKLIVLHGRQDERVLVEATRTAA